MTDLPYVLTMGKIPDLLDKIAAAARPERFSQDFLEKLGFGSSNDRAFVPLFRRLGFVSESGNPTPAYDDLRDPTKRAATLAQQMRQLYADHLRHQHVDLQCERHRAPGCCCAGHW